MLSSTSFAVFETNLDSCPKCGKNICEHASVADVINLPNSLSQDFSTYSSDSSLIKQLLNESCTSTTTRTNSTINFEPKISLNAINELFLKQKNNCAQDDKEQTKKRKFRLFNKNRQLNCLSSSSSASSSSSSTPSSSSSTSSFQTTNIDNNNTIDNKSSKKNKSKNNESNTYISVKLNNFYYYNYEKTVCKSSSSTASSTITDSIITEIQRPNTNVNIRENQLDVINKEKELFCSSSSNDFDNNEINIEKINNYHKITVIFVLIGLFSFNFLQETFLLIYYLNSNQTHWLFSSLIGAFTGQCLTLIVSFLSEISSSSSTTTTTTIHSTQILFKNPFSKLCLLIPGYLPLSCFVQFFRLILNYKKSCGQEKFLLEYKLSLLFYFNSLFYTLPLIIVNCCYLSSSSRLNWYYTDLLTVSSDATIMFIFSPESRPRNQFMILLVSIFVSISIGLCLFLTYYELIKQMRTVNTGCLKRFVPDTQWLRLGIIELLVYFCFKFCLITSRLCILALFWYLFNQLLLVFVCIHILVLFVLNVTGLFKQQSENEKKSKLNDLITIKIVSILGLVDLFINQSSELKNTKRVFAYYFINFIQNSLILSYWLVQVLYNEQSSQKIFYTTLIYLSVLLFNVFGLILKFLHIHIIKKRYAKIFEFNAPLIIAAPSIHSSNTNTNQQ